MEHHDLVRLGFEGLIRIYCKAHADFRFIQIGANDGFSGDPIYRFIQEFDWTGILVEPQKEVFDTKLQILYGTNPKIHLENVAVAEENGHMTLYKVAFSNSRWATGLASFKKSHIEKHIVNGYIEKNMKGKEHLLPQSKEDYITSENVKTVIFQNLISKYKIESLDLLQIDVEGYDYQILKSFDLSVVKPSIIQYEHLHMSRDEQSDLKFHLSKSGYIQFKENINTICIKMEMLKQMDVF